jgi:hypothetical protein
MTPIPGTVNYIDSAQGKTELLLTPGVFLRLGNDSALHGVV